MSINERVVEAAAVATTFLVDYGSVFIGISFSIRRGRSGS